MTDSKQGIKAIKAGLLEGTNLSELHATILAADLWTRVSTLLLAPLVDGAGREGPADADDPAALLAREVRRQCAEQVREVATSIEAGNLYDEPLPAAIAKELRTLAASWDEEQGGLSHGDSVRTRD